MRRSVELRVPPLRGNESRLSALGPSSRSRFFAKYLGSHPLCAATASRRLRRCIPPCAHLAAIKFMPRQWIGCSPRAVPCGHFASLVRSTFGLRDFPPNRRYAPHLRRITAPPSRFARSSPLAASLQKVRINSVDFTWSDVRLIRCSDDCSLQRHIPHKIFVPVNRAHLIPDS